jgi:hypothetical protein
MEQSDHDLLVELKTEMKFLRVDVKEIKDGTSAQLEDHEKRIRTLELLKSKYFWTTAIYSTIGATMITLIIYHILQK